MLMYEPLNSRHGGQGGRKEGGESQAPIPTEKGNVKGRELEVRKGR